MKISAVIVNYNDWISTYSLANKLLSFECLDYVVVVDNASSDNSKDQLSIIRNPKYFFIPKEQNLGYGEGNNIGVFFSKRNLNCTHSLILNPDVDIEEKTVKDLINTYSREDSCFIVAPSSFSGNKRIVWKVRGLIDLVFSQEMFLSRLFKIPFYNESYFIGQEYCEVDAVLGACLMVDTYKFEKIGGYDKNMFLYEEENYLALKCKSFNYKTIVLCNSLYIHNHKRDDLKSLSQQLITRNRMNNSLLYLVKYVCNYGLFTVYFVKIFLKLCNCELVLRHYIKSYLKCILG